jgi:hypothetical protein
MTPFCKCQFTTSEPSKSCSSFTLAGLQSKTILEASEDPSRNEQVIIVTGISGSGKTTAIRRCLELRSGSFNDNEHCKRVWGKFVAQSIVMESFGNAVTRNNPDSSRMGRMIKVGATSISYEPL